jgi:hypothetical protein
MKPKASSKKDLDLKEFDFKAFLGFVLKKIKRFMSRYAFFEKIQKKR